MSKLFEFFDRFDLILLLCVSALTLFGILMVFSSTESSPLLVMDGRLQLLWAAIGLIVMGIAAVIDFRKLLSYSGMIYIFVVFLLVDVLIFGGGGQDVERWIPLGSFHLQPSELAKISVILILAAYLGRLYQVRLQNILATFVLAGIPVSLVIIQPNLGTAVVLSAIVIGVLFMAGIKLRWMIVFALIGIILVAAVFNLGLLKDYQMKRLLVFMNPQMDPLGSGYNLAQSKIAVGSGGLSGKGLFKGTQSRLNFLPARHTDFIFAVVGEELGFYGASLLIGLYLILFSRGLRIAGRCVDRGGSLIASGIVTMFAFQVFVNIGMTVGIMPITGLPLPFISYGGSALITNMTAAGLLMNVNWRYRPRGLTLATDYAYNHREGYIKKYQRSYE